jgi:hypothetical protein
MSGSNEEYHRRPSDSGWVWERQSTHKEELQHGKYCGESFAGRLLKDSILHLID